MLELGVAMSTNVDIIVIAEESSFVNEQERWKSQVQQAVNSKDFEKLESYLKDSKFINLVPSDVRERSVHLFNNIDDLKSKIQNAINQLT
jgi:hypothetical protein